MTDPFADLERELLVAHARDLRPRRNLRAAPRALALTATAVAAAAAVFAVVWAGGRIDDERVAQPQPAGPPATCDGGWEPPETAQGPPSGIPAEMAVFREERPPGAVQIEPRMFRAQATRIYRDTLRSLPETNGYAVWAIVADIVPRWHGRAEPRDHCRPPQGPTEPGACLVLFKPRGSLSACFTLGEIEGGEAFIDTDGRIIGFGPDTAAFASAGSEQVAVSRNLFTLRGGPETKVTFRPETS
jgi:hypothetical protein